MYWEITWKRGAISFVASILRANEKHDCVKRQTMLHLGFETGTGGRDGGPLRKIHDSLRPAE